MQTGNCGGEAFALRVLGDTMEPEFKHGNIIIVDPSAHLYDGCFVVVRDGEEYSLRQMHQNEEGYRFQVLKGDDSPLHREGIQDIVGMVVQRASGLGRRKGETKHYI